MDFFLLQASVRWKLLCFVRVSGEWLYDELMVYGNFYANFSSHVFSAGGGVGGKHEDWGSKEKKRYNFHMNLYET